MLPESERTILEAAVNGLLSSFDPLDAMQEIGIRELFTKDEFNLIKNNKNRQSRISTFFRFYVRKSGITLEPLREYFRHSTQGYLADLLCGIGLLPSCGGPSTSGDCATTHPRILHALSETMVPPRVKNHVQRQGMVKMICDKLISLANMDSFWLVLEGVAGSGKTSLIVDVLRDCPHLLSMYFSDVIWVRDQSTESSQLANVFAHTRVMVTQAESLERFSEDPEAMKLDVAKCLSAMSFPLVIVDEVYLEESVRWFDGLNCRIVTTSSNRGIFRSAANHVERVTLDSCRQFSTEDTRKMFSDSRPTPSTSLINSLVTETGGNPALISKIKELSRNRTDRLQRWLQLLKEGQLHRLKCSTSYPSASMCDAFSKMTSSLTSGEIAALKSLTKFSPETSFSLADALKTMPIDVCGRQSEVDRALEILEVFVDCILLEEVETNADNLEEHYRYQMSPAIHKFLCDDPQATPEETDGRRPKTKSFWDVKSWLGMGRLLGISTVIAGAAFIGFRRFSE
ncbi:hypothetical protein L596_024415 [Steinernema carpocapsae]|uniref:NB-ARC domain-containing protein n=1 Tax=Steinernema carpocapsae TaxID=34508 RepID=A0A4U5MGN3_STECR|nr:hypothetical protein L596_024415 [Steinernema carpocapsae]